ncbi:MAG: NAD(+)/NADH kinase [Clostridia bacterium]|nr:NAD(+)/NADH kinase [Clostridia bacterium]
MKIFVYSNSNEESLKIKEELQERLTNQHEFSDKLDYSIQLVICIGGDGTFLRFLNAYDFPYVPILGINTGHLGFYQDFTYESLCKAIENFEHDNYSLQKLNPIRIQIKSSRGTEVKHSLNEVTIKAFGNYPLHLNVALDGQNVERFNGDGLLISSSAGSTAYNYSLGGSIVDPRLKLIQVSPIAPLNSTAYRSFTSSIVLPWDMTLSIKPELHKHQEKINIFYDGFTETYDDLEEISIRLSNSEVHLVRKGDYDFWTKAKEKFL